MIKKQLFLASSTELAEDRREFRLFVDRRNNEWIDRGVFIELVVWEDFLDVMAQTRLQDEYNKAIRDCDIFVMLFWTKVGQFTEEEFETAFGQFKVANKPLIFTYFKNAEIMIGSINQTDIGSLFKFQNKLRTLGHFQTVYKNIDDLKFQFSQQLDKLAKVDNFDIAPKSTSAEPLPSDLSPLLSAQVSAERFYMVLVVACAVTGVLISCLSMIVNTPTLLSPR